MMRPTENQRATPKPREHWQHWREGTEYRIATVTQAQAPPVSKVYFVIARHTELNGVDGEPLACQLFLQRGRPIAGKTVEESSRSWLVVPGEELPQPYVIYYRMHSPWWARPLTNFLDTVPLSASGYRFTRVDAQTDSLGLGPWPSESL